MDASEVEWAHAVNNRQELEVQLAGSVDFLEADISMGHVTGQAFSPPIPIMAHPPDIISDISLENWLDTVIARSTRKGVKLDFKSIETVEPSLQILQKHGKKVNFPLWLNADILSGPVDAQAPVNAAKFLELCRRYFPDATLSVGWTTLWFPTLPSDSGYYDWRHVRAMVDTLHCSGFRPENEWKLTFPVRALFAVKSIPQLQWLLRIFPSSSLTVWSSKHDIVDPKSLLKLRESFNISRVFYDIPDPVKTEFNKLKKEAEVVPFEDMSTENRWKTIYHEESNASCSHITYIDKATIFFGKGSTTTVFTKDSYQVSEGKNIQVKGFVRFFMSEINGLKSKPSGSHELVFSLIDVTSLKKIAVNESEASNDDVDNDVIWNALNSSRLYTFTHKFSHISPSACYYFKLNTSKDEVIQVWELPCYVFLDGLPEEDILKQGKPQIGNNMKLVLPDNPIILGFISSGSGQAVIYDFETAGEASTTSQISTSANDFMHTCPISILLTIILLILNFI